MEASRPMFRYIDGVLIYNAWDNDFAIIRCGRFGELFKTQIQNENINVPHLCIFDCANEGVGTLDIDVMIDAISDEYPNLEVRVLFNIFTNKNTKYKYRCLPEHLVTHFNFVSHVKSLDINWRDISINKYFISLQRRASVGRLRFTKQLLDSFTSDMYILSCGSQPNKWLNKLPNLKETIHPYKLPILADGIADSDLKQHHHTNVDFFKCFVNVVTETSSQTDNDSWRDIFITEKTFKVFAYRQIPLWFAVPGTVQVVRDLGFDVFDDVFNHSYDTEYDPAKRSDLVVTELYKFINDNSIHEINNLRQQLWSRINKNANLLFKLNDITFMNKSKLIKELCNEF